jgi:hypothetical protein
MAGSLKAPYIRFYMEDVLMRMKSIATVGAVLLAGVSLSACVANGGYYGYADTYYAPAPVPYVAAPVYPAPYYGRSHYYDGPRYRRSYHHRRGYYRDGY